MNHTARSQFKGVRTVPAGRPDIGPHSHHWLIDTPCGPTSEGVCTVCGERRVFPNSLPELDSVGFDGHFGPLGTARRIHDLGFHVEDGEEDNGGAS